MYLNTKAATAYVDKLSRLYKNVREWVSDNNLIINEQAVQMLEESTGPYQATTLIIQRRDGHVIARLKPIGAVIIGASGRVDIEGNLDTKTIIYLEQGGPKITVNTSAGGPQHSYSRNLFQGASRAGWYWIEDKRIGKAKHVTKQLFRDLLTGASDFEFR